MPVKHKFLDTYPLSFYNEQKLEGWWEHFLREKQ